MGAESGEQGPGQRLETDERSGTIIASVAGGVLLASADIK